MGEANFYYFTCLNFAEVVLKSIIVISIDRSSTTFGFLPLNSQQPKQTK